jgi:hypothetical protein
MTEDESKIVYSVQGRYAKSRKKISSGDIVIDKSDKGFVLTDRTNGKRYRLYMDDGVLKTEET